MFVCGFTENERPIMRDINRYTRKYATDWNDIGLELGLDFEALAIIEKDNPSNCVACFKEMIHNWLRLTDNATWKDLEIALTNVNRQKLEFDPVDDVYGMETVNVYMYVCIYIRSN